MARRNPYLDGAEVKKFVRIGLVAFIALAAGGYFMKHLADQQMAADNPVAWRPRNQASDGAPTREPGPLSAFQPERVSDMPVEERIRNWQQRQRDEATAAGGPPTSRQVPAPSRL